MKVLVTGGAGYIGSHTVQALRESGHQVVIIDNLSSQLGPYPQGVPLQQVDITDYQALQKACEHITFDAVMHFAAKIEVNESMSQPILYYHNNVAGLLNVTRLMKEKNCSKIIFSSTAAVYGMPEQSPISESTPLAPINVYGRTKLMCEQILQDSCTAFGWSATVLRYFNAAGASTDGTLGQNRPQHSHVIPLMILALLNNKPFKIFGTQYSTKDGTAVRDYIHVQDLADAHLRALENSNSQVDTKSSKEAAVGAFQTYNVGTGVGYSVRDLIDGLEKISGKKLNVVEEGPRAGDPPVLIASPEKIIKELAWKPRYSDITTILNTAYYWHKKLASKEEA